MGRTRSRAVDSLTPAKAKIIKVLKIVVIFLLALAIFEYVDGHAISRKEVVFTSHCAFDGKNDEFSTIKYNIWRLGEYRALKSGDNTPYGPGLLCGAPKYFHENAVLTLW